MFPIIHIDDEWFYMTRQNQEYYLLPNEQEPHHTCKSKRFITKVMFMNAVVRPRHSKDWVCVFDEKIEILSFIIEKPAFRSNKNKVKDVLEVKPFESINKSVIKQCLIEIIIFTIKDK